MGPRRKYRNVPGCLGVWADVPRLKTGKNIVASWKNVDLWSETRLKAEMEVLQRGTKAVSWAPGGGRKRLWVVLKKNNYLGIADSGKNPNNVPIRKQKQGLFMKKGRGTIITSVKRRHFYWCREAK